MMIDSIADDTQIPIRIPSISSTTWETSQLQQIQQLSPCSQDLDDLTTPTQDEYTRWILTASQKKLQRESRIQRLTPTNQQNDIITPITEAAAEDDSTMKGSFSEDDEDDSGDDMEGKDGNDFEMNTTKQAFNSQGKNRDINKTGPCNHQASPNRKNQTRRRHTSLPATTPTRLPTPKTSSIHQHLSPHIFHSNHATTTTTTTSPLHPFSTSGTIHDGSSLSQHKQQQSTTTSWLDFDPIASRKQQRLKRRPVSMVSSSLGTKPSYSGVCVTHRFNEKSDQQLMDLDASSIRGTLKCIGKDEEIPGLASQTNIKSPKTPISQNTTITTRIPLPTNKKTSSNIGKLTTIPSRLESYNKTSTHEPSKQQPVMMDSIELRRRPSLMSSDALKDQQKQLQQHLDINLVSVQGELCVPDCISQRGLVYRQHQRDPPLSSTTLPKNRPLTRRVSSLHERLQELVHDDSAWNEITKPTMEMKGMDATFGPENKKKKNISIPPPPPPPSASASASSQQQIADLTFTARKHSNTQTGKPLSPKCHHGPFTDSPPSSAPPPRPAMSPPTAYKLYKPLLSPFEQQEIHNYPQIYFVGNHAKNKHRATMDRHHGNYGYDDGRGDYIMVPRDHLAYRYEMLEIMGKGSFGKVIKAFDYKLGSTVAVKIIRNRKRFHAQALVEVKTLEDLLKWDPHDKHNNVRMTDHFYFRNHLCIAFECLDINLYDFIKGNNFQGFSMGLIRRFTIQLLNSLVLLHQHHLIHCDLKPENVLLKDPTKSTIKVIDFGSSCLENEKVYTYIQSRFYRAPEVMLGFDYGVEIDMWSVGCILAELYTGCPLFPGENEQDQLACIMEIQGVPSLSLVEKCTRRKLFFDAYGNPKITTNSKGKKRRPDTKTLTDVLKCSDNKFVDFIDRCLQWNPSDRIKSDEAFRHGWIARQQYHLQQ